MKRFLILTMGCLLGGGLLPAQDTFSIVALDSVTGEVGSAGASCVDLFTAPGYTNHFLGDLIPGLGAINTQAYYLASNQTNARTQMYAGDTPQQIIDWLVANDVQGNPGIRQYGIVGFVNGAPQAAAHTGANTNDYKNHIVGPNYSIQGNILLGQEVLDSMEAQFLRAPGDLACKLMAALQGANMVGADTRCAGNGTSSLFAFVKVSQSSDTYGSPSFLVSLKTHNGAGIEPIDSLQVLFDQVKSCNATAVVPAHSTPQLRIHPNPAGNQLCLEWPVGNAEPIQVEIWNALGNPVAQSLGGPSQTIDLEGWPAGLYSLRIRNGQWQASKVFLKQ